MGHDLNIPEMLQIQHPISTGKRAPKGSVSDAAVGSASTRHIKDTLTTSRP